METQKKNQTHFIPTSQLKLYNVVNGSGEDLGQVQNFITDMCSSRIAYVLVAFEGFLGLTDKWIPVPFDALTWVPETNRFEMDISRKTMEQAPTISKSEWPDKFLAKLEMRDHSSWLENVYKYYNRTPYWIEYTAEPCCDEARQPEETGSITITVNVERTEAVSENPPPPPESARAAALDAINAATAAEEAAREAALAKSALTEACAAAARADEIAKAAAREASKATDEAARTAEAANRAEDIACAARGAADEANARAEAAARIVETAARRAEDTARASKYAADEDASKAQRAAMVAREAASAAGKALEESDVCTPENTAPNRNTRS